jgi:hypothetical protein
MTGRYHDSFVDARWVMRADGGEMVIQGMHTTLRDVYMALANEWVWLIHKRKDRFHLTHLDDLRPFKPNNLIVLFLPEGRSFRTIDAAKFAASIQDKKRLTTKRRFLVNQSKAVTFSTVIEEEDPEDG